MDLSGSMQGAGGVGGLLAVSDTAATGVIQTHYEYDAFGNTTVSTGDKKANFKYETWSKCDEASLDLEIEYQQKSDDYFDNKNHVGDDGVTRFPLIDKRPYTPITSGLLEEWNVLMTE
jgi:hypothetical protein